MDGGKVEAPGTAGLSALKNFGQDVQPVVHQVRQDEGL